MSLLLSAQREAEERARKRIWQGQPTPWKTSVGGQHKPREFTCAHTHGAQEGVKGEWWDEGGAAVSVREAPLNLPLFPFLVPLCLAPVETTSLSLTIFSIFDHLLLLHGQASATELT